MRIDVRKNMYARQRLTQVKETYVGYSVGELDGKSLNAIDGADEGGGVGDLLGIFVGCKG